MIKMKKIVKVASTPADKVIMNKLYLKLSEIEAMKNWKAYGEVSQDAQDKLEEITSALSESLRTFFYKK
jgi:hypothetical protein